MHSLLVQADKNWLATLMDGEVRFDEPMRRHTSFRVGGPADAFAVPRTVSQLKKIVTGAAQRSLPIQVIGGGSNVLVKDGGVRGIVVLLHRCLTFIDKMESTPKRAIIKVGAGLRLAAFCHFALKEGLKGLNFALGIPGSIGGAIVTNAGTSLGIISKLIERIDILLASGECSCLPLQKVDFGPPSKKATRPSISTTATSPIVLSAWFRLTPERLSKLEAEAALIVKMRQERQPTGLPSAGCFFKNPSALQPAGKLIDQAGMKGQRIGGAQVSMQHANFIVNRQNASATDILALKTKVQVAVETRFNIKLTPEVHIIGDPIKK